MIAALDAGHGSCSGARARGLVEDDVALDMVRRIGHHLRLAGVGTVYLRPDEALVPITVRARLARQHGCRCLLSIHINAGQASAHGAEAFYADGDKRSADFAFALLKTVAETGLSIRGAKPDNHSQHTMLGILRGVCKRMHAVLLELGFLTNASDAALLSDKLFREKLAKVIARGVLAFFLTVQAGAEPSPA